MYAGARVVAPLFCVRLIKDPMLLLLVEIVQLL